MSASEKSRRGGCFFRGLGISIAFVLFGWLWVYAYDHIRVVRLDDFFDPRYGYPVGYREKYFSQDYPSASEIKEYLTDSTLLHSLPGPASGNDVFYFDDNPGFVYWRGKTVVSGAWRTSPFLEISRLGSRWRIALVQRFCKWHFDMSADEQQDNCYAIHGLDGLISYGNQSRRDYRKGNVFNLENNKPAPFKIPDTDITIDSLLAQRPSGQN